jgi:hypothetical protein
MTKSVIFNSAVFTMLKNFNGQLLNNVEVKKKFTSESGSIDCLFRFEKTVFLFVFKWDKGIMSANNTIQFLKSCDIVINNINKQHPDKIYTFYKVAVTKKPINFPGNVDINGAPKLFNVHLDPEHISDIIPSTFENTLMEYVITKLYNNICYTINKSPNITNTKIDEEQMDVS